MSHQNLIIQNDSLFSWGAIPVPAQAISVCPAKIKINSSEATSKKPHPSMGAAFNICALWRSRRLVLPMATAPLFYSRRVSEWKIKHIHDKMFTALFTARRELAADPDADSRRTR